MSENTEGRGCSTYVCEEELDGVNGQCAGEWVSSYADTDGLS